ncbi:hypothetical protein [Roseibium sp. M-1]
MIPLTLPEPSSFRPRVFTWLVLALCVLGTAHLVDRITAWTGASAWPIQDLTAKPVSVSVGSARFELMPGFIASARQRRQSLEQGAVFETLRLAMSWPDLGIVGNSSGKDTLLIELESNRGRESLRARLDPFYRRLARGGEISGPDGLKVLRLSASGSAATDLVVYDPSEQNGFIARCRKEPSTGSATCHRAIVFSSGLELRYSFNQALLPDWRRLDASVAAKIREFQRP